MMKKWLAALLLCGLLLGYSGPITAQNAPAPAVEKPADVSVEAKIEEQITAASDKGVDLMWDDLLKIEAELKKTPEPSTLLRKLRQKNSDAYMLAVAYLQNGVNDLRAGGEKLIDLLGKDDANINARVYACRLLGSRAEDIRRRQFAVATSAALFATKKFPLEVEMAYCRLIYDIFEFNNSELGRKAMGACEERLMKHLTGNDPAARNQAALALAHIGKLDAAKPVLQKIADLPNKEGLEARQILNGGELYNELIEAIHNQYVDGDVDSDELIEGGAMGLVEKLDPFSSYMSAKEVREMSEKISGSYAGIGAYVSTEEGILVIQSPIYGGPAYKAGIRALDKVLEIDGTKTTELTITECVNRMKGEPKTPVKLKIWRASFREPKEIVVLRDNINMPKLYTLLPGKIGYVRLTTYGKNTGKELQEMMDEMREKGMRALVLDLRNNPGGLLNAAVDVVGKFVKRGAEVVTVRPRAGIAEMERHVSSEPSPDIEIPLVVLINGGSASASEITAGALLDYGRAKLVGTRSYGKGSVQTLLPVRTTGYKTRLRLTIAKYYLPRTEKYPDGRCIHRNPKSENKDERRGGVKPDLFCRFVEFEGWIEDEIISFRSTDATFKYWKQNYNEQTKKTFEELAENDGGDWKKYPGFEEWAKSLNTKLPYDDLRRELRRYVRLQVADLHGKAFVADVEEDNQLQRAIISLYQDYFKKEDGKTVPEYKSFFEKFEQNKFLGLTPRKDGLEEE